MTLKNGENRGNAGENAGGIMKFKLDNSFDDNLALFKAEAEKIDPECAKILFDNLHLLDAAGEAAPGRAAIGEFHKAVQIALDDLQKAAAGDNP